MKIESIIKRDPPTEVVLGDTTYKFKPDDQGKHVAEVTDKHHIARFLSIVEGFQLADADETLPKSVETELVKEVEERTKQPVIVPVDENILKGSAVHPATFDVKGEQVSIEDVIADAHEASGMTTAEWNEMPDEARHGLIDAILDAMAGEQGDDNGNDDASDDSGDDNNSQDSQETPPPPAADPADAEAAAKAEREELAAQWKVRTGSLPHYKWTAEKIRAELAKPVEEAK